MFSKKIFFWRGKNNVLWIFWLSTVKAKSWLFRLAWMPILCKHRSTVIFSLRMFLFICSKISWSEHVKLLPICFSLLEGSSDGLCCLRWMVHLLFTGGEKISNHSAPLESGMSYWEKGRINAIREKADLRVFSDVKSNS